MVGLVPTTSGLDAVGARAVTLCTYEPSLHYRVPLNMVSDWGPQWNTKNFQAMCDIAGVKVTLFTPLHPRTNWLVECNNEVIAAVPRHYVTAD
jgi:hypothetical protein